MNPADWHPNTERAYRHLVDGDSSWEGFRLDLLSQMLYAADAVQGA